MQLTQTELEWLIAEAAPLLEESAIQRVLETGERERVLQARRPGQTLLLEVVTDPETARIHLTPERGQQPGYPSSFTMLMRKWVQGMVIASVEMVPDDRIFVIRGDVVDPRWDPEVEPIEEEESPPRAEVALVVELMGRLTNLFVLGAGDQILGMERGDAVKGRELGVGDVWAPPPPPPGQTPQPNRWAEADLPPSEEAAVDGAPRSSYASAWFDEHLARWRREQLIKELRRALKRQVKRLRRLVKNVEGDLERAEDAQQWRRHGELLQSAYGKVERGTELVRVPDYYQEGMPEVEIPLDPSRSLQDNIDRYFKEYRRLHEALERIEARLLESMESLERAEEARGALEARAEDTLGELETWRDELRQEGILPEPRSHKRGRSSRGSQKKPPYRTFRSGRGETILVGRGAKQNDEVSTHVARGRDMWMHARDWAGAHVLLRMKRGEEPHHADLLDAALLAAHFSKGRADTLVDVTYTRAKHVRKPKGYPVGMVTIADGSTLGVKRDPARLERLLATEER